MAKWKPNQKIIDANIQVHSVMAESYGTNEPHFHQENKDKVRKRLEKYFARTEAVRHLDVACGSGFIIDLAHDLVQQVHGIDITKSMLDLVDLSPGNIQLHESVAEATAFADNYFDVATGYSCLDHFEDYGAVMQEVFRVLKPGGIAYFDLIPNALYWEAVAKIPALAADGASWGPDVVREMNWLKNNDKNVEAQFGIPAEVFRQAEPYKEKGGVKPDTLYQTLMDIGYSKVEIHFDWFLGEANVIHGDHPEHRDIIQNYLKTKAPMTHHLFKYLYFVAVK